MPGHSRHNSTAYIMINNRICRACWECIEACPEGVIGKVNLPFHKHARIDNAGKCNGCQKCVRVCPQQAIITYRIKQQDAHKSVARVAYRDGWE